MGFNSPIGDNGIKLSGGQKQKIAIARAVIRKPKLLILDEPTNHLDPSSVNHLLSVLKNLKSNPTVLLITQNEKVAKEAEFVLELGKQGTIRDVSRDYLSQE